MAIKSESTVEVRRKFHASAETIFDAISKGVLLRTCGAKSETIKIDFREGGAWSVVFAPDHPKQGKYLKIEKNKTVAFTWGNDGKVTITLSEDKSVTQLHLLHEGISSVGHCADIDGGWRDGLNDFTPEVSRTIKITRELNAPIAQVFELCAGPHFFLRTGAVLETGSTDFRIGGKYTYKVAGCTESDFVEGEFTDILPNRRIAFTWNSLCPSGPTGETLVLLDFSKKDENKTIVTLTHTGFPDEGTAKDHEGGWNEIFDKLQSELNRV
jgi:uncharacterized protein YndB with AHSA1/START domain